MGRSPRFVSLPPEVAYLLLRDHGRALSAKARDVRGGNPRLSRQIGFVLEQCRAASEELFAEGGIGSGVQAWNGSSELPLRRDGAGSGSPLGGGSGLTVRAVAEILEVGERQVINRIRSSSSRLSATKHRGRWVIDELSVVMEQQRGARGGV